jgi:hypothetical protein
LNGTISQALAPPGTNEGVIIVQAVMNELDFARFYPLLMLVVARNVGAALDGAMMRAEGLVSFLGFE